MIERMLKGIIVGKKFLLVGGVWLSLQPRAKKWREVLQKYATISLTESRKILLK